MKSSAIALAGLIALGMLGSALPASGQTIRGTVVDRTTGAAVPQASIEARSGNLTTSATSDAEGAFVLYLRRGGLYQLDVSRIGYTSIDSMVVQVGTRELVELRIPIDTSPVVLGGIAVEARRSDPRFLATHEGFRVRRALALPVGRRRVVLNTDPEMANAGVVRDVLRWFLPARRCVDYYIDGMAVDPLFWAEVVPTLPATILEGIEYYRDDWERPLGFAPPPRPLELAGATCSVIALWRTGRP